MIFDMRYIFSQHDYFSYEMNQVTNVPKSLIRSSFFDIVNDPLCNQYQAKYWKATNKQIWKNGKKN